jgi:hypothetical protein
MAELMFSPKKPKCVRKRGTSKKRVDALIGRLWKAAEQRVAELENRLSHDTLIDSERNARSLAVLVKVLRELALLDAQLYESSEGGDSHKDLVSSHSVPVYDSANLDKLRHTLAERLAHLDSSGENISAPK